MDALQLSSLPDIPSDIARLLLEAAAWEDRPTAYNLVLVSKVVRQWIDPILHYSVALCMSKELIAFHKSIISRNDNAFFSRAVKVLCIGDRSTGGLPPPGPDYPNPKVWTWVKAVLNACRGVDRLAVWLIGRDLELDQFTGKSGPLHPTHMSLLDLTAHGWIARQDCINILPGSLTHLNLDCEGNEDIEDIPWKDIFARCPNLAHILLSGRAIHDNFNDGELFSHVVDPIVSELPDTIATFSMVVAPDTISDRGVHIFEDQLNTVAKASDRFVVVCHDISYRGQIQGLLAFEKDHTFDSEWGNWRDMDTWELAEKCVANRKRKRHDERSAGLKPSSLT
ncbi:hypothetical protein BDZ89DRAFT_1082821 [Hymenopellis radicata]|nr:hypothetical protein BDZ89DRAFT_1082821 [Hymenopellis radicata]